MTLPMNPGRRSVMKWGIASAGIPLAAHALAPVAAANPKPEDTSERGESAVTLRPGLQIHYKDEWFGAPWLDPQAVVFLHGNLETNSIWYGWVPRMAQRYRLLLPDLPGYGGSTAPADFE